MEPAVTYELLADGYERRAEPRLRDVFLALAADAYAASGQPDQAERARQKLLQRSPYHLLKPYASFTEALKSPDVLDYLQDLRQKHPPGAAEKMMPEVRPDAPLGPSADWAHAPAPAETLLGASSSGALRRRPAPSPYGPAGAAPLPEKVDPNVLAWAPSVLFALVLFLSLSWALYIFVGPFLD
jgi:hypothetical protein